MRGAGYRNCDAEPSPAPRERGNPARQGWVGEGLPGARSAPSPASLRLAERGGLWRYIVAVVVVLSACTVGPDYRRPGAPVPALYKEAGWKVGEPLDAIDRGAWWSVYNDPVLDDLERQIDISNQNLQAAEAAFQRAEWIVAQARAGFF